jgi:hypothetical protein
MFDFQFMHLEKIWLEGEKIRWKLCTNIIVTQKNKKNNGEKKNSEYENLEETEVGVRINE